MFAPLLVFTVLSANAAAVPDPPAVSCARPRKADDVARRAVALGFLSTRAWLETRMPGLKSPAQVRKHRQRAKDLVTRARSTGAWNVLSADEQQVLLLPSGAWNDDQLRRHSWDMEGAGVLLWALSARPDVPDYEHPMTMDWALRPITPDGAAEALIKQARVRPATDLEKAWLEAELFGWRVGAELERRRNGARGVEGTLKRIIAAGQVRHHDGKDFKVGDEALGDLEDRQLGWVRSASRARSDAFRFACGG